MNEEELKAIWKKEEKFSAENFDFERIKNNASKAQKKLQTKIKWDIATNILVYVIGAPVFFYFPKALIVLPFATAVWVWYLWEVLRIYKYDTNFQKSENIKNFLLGKEKLLTDYIKRSRLIGYLGVPIILFVCYPAMSSLEYVWKFPMPFLISLIAAEIAALVLIEIYVRKIYAPVIDELKNLLQQLND